MIRRISALTTLVGLLLVGGIAEAKLVAVLNKRNPTRSMDASTLKSIFLGQKAFWKGTVPVRVLGRDSSSGGAKALMSVLGMNESQFEAHWTKRQLSGKGVKPKTVDSLDELVKMIGKTPTAVSVVEEAELDGLDLSKVKTLPIE